MKESKEVVKQCIQSYFMEDTTVMMDDSILRIKGVIFYLYDLIYFGNKIVISEEALRKIEHNKIMSKNFQKNAFYLLENMRKDRHGNYQIVEMSQYGSNLIDRVANYLRANNHVFYLVGNKNIFIKLKKQGLEEQVRLLDKNIKISSLCKNKTIKFETIGMITHEAGRMLITKRCDGVLVKVYDSAGKEKKGNCVEVEVNDIVLIRNEKNVKYSFNLYVIISKHRRHQAVRIIWTDVIKGQKTNFYIERLEDIYKNIIESNM